MEESGERQSRVETLVLGPFFARACLFAACSAFVYFFLAFSPELFFFCSAHKMVGEKNACVPLKFTFSFACPNDFCRLQSFFPLSGSLRSSSQIAAPQYPLPQWKLRIKLIFSLFEVFDPAKSRGNSSSKTGK